MMKEPWNAIPTRRSLLTRLKSWEDQEGWQVFFDTYWRLIYSVAIKSGLTDVEAQEVVQETIISIAKKMGEFRYDPARGSFKSWLLHNTRWRIADQFRKRPQTCQPLRSHSTDTTSTSTVERIPDTESFSFESVWEEEWKKNLFEAAVEKIRGQVKPKHFQVFDLYVIKQWPVRQVARTLGVNIGQIYVIKHRISGLIKQEIKALQEKIL